eukprot:EG_transcript_18001
MRLLLAFLLTLPSSGDPGVPPPPNCTGLSAADLAGGGVGVAPFAREDGQKAPQRWEAAACPAESTTFSCYRRDYQRAWELEHRPFPGACRLFSDTAFLKLIQGRSLLFVGDSIMGQFWSTVTCLLPRNGTQYALPWLNSNASVCAVEVNNCSTDIPIVTYPNDARLLYKNDLKLQGTTDTFLEWGATNNSIVVVNSGLHFHQPKPYRNRLQRFVNHHLRFIADHPKRPTVVWAETPPQHFAGTPNGYFDPGRKKKWSAARCVPVNRLAAWKTDWRNRLAEGLMAQAGIPVLRLWDATVNLWDFHVMNNGRSDGLDCTHYCVPGAPTLWAVRLLEALEALLPPQPADRTAE